jgi:hypothetical protein
MRPGKPYRLSNPLPHICPNCDHTYASEGTRLVAQSFGGLVGRDSSQAPKSTLNSADQRLIIHSRRMPGAKSDRAPKRRSRNFRSRTDWREYIGSGNRICAAEFHGVLFTIDDPGTESPRSSTLGEIGNAECGRVIIGFATFSRLTPPGATADHRGRINGDTSHSQDDLDRTDLHWAVVQVSD